MNISRLIELIEGKKYTKAALAAKCGFSRVTIDNLLSGADVKISTIEGVASAYNVPVGYFFDDETKTVTQKGDRSVMVGRDNNGTIGDLRDCEKELEHTKALLAEKELMLAEKERLITVLMDKKQATQT